MKMAKSVLVIFGFLHLCVSSAIADGAGLEWKILNQQVHDLYDAGMYGRAVVVAREALELAEKNASEDHPDIAISLGNLASMYRAQEHHDKAEPLFIRALDIFEKVLGTDYPHIATNLNNLGLLYIKQGHYDKAEPLFKRALAIDEKALGCHHPSVAPCLTNLAELYRAMKREREARELEIRATKKEKMPR